MKSVQSNSRRVLVIGGKPNQKTTRHLQIFKNLFDKGWKFVTYSKCVKAQLCEVGIDSLILGKTEGCPWKLSGHAIPDSKTVSALLANRDNSDEMEDLSFHNIVPIDIVIYLHGESLIPYQDGQNNIDVNLFSYLIPAIENYRHVTVVTDSADYESVVDAFVNDGNTSISAREKLRLKATNLLAQWFGSFNKIARFNSVQYT